MIVVFPGYLHNTYSMAATLCHVILCKQAKARFEYFLAKTVCKQHVNLSIQPRLQTGKGVMQEELFREQR